jgi:hypothetical protein
MTTARMTMRMRMRMGGVSAGRGVRRLWSWTVVVLLVVGVCLGVGGGVARAVVPAPAWKLTSIPIPTVMPAVAGTEREFRVVLENVGGAASEGEVTVRDKLPQGVTVTDPQGGKGTVSDEEEQFPCEQVGGSEVVCHFASAVVSSGFAEINIHFHANNAVGEVLRNTVSVSGGGGGPVSRETATRVGAPGETGPAGISEFAFGVTGPAGEPVRQAAGHPTLMTITSFVNNELAVVSGVLRLPVEPIKDLVFYLPLGFLGDPQVAVRCPQSLIDIGGDVSGCPPGSQEGTILPMVFSFNNTTSPTPTGGSGIYNVAPERGYAAQFVFTAFNKSVYQYASVVRHDGAYMLRVATPGIPVNAQTMGIVASLYGDSREQYPTAEGEFSRELGAFFTNPSVCSTEPLDASMEMTTWVHPHTPFTQSAAAYPAGLEGCGELRFSSLLSARPTSTQADEPSGYGVDLEIPQAPNEFGGLGTPPAKDFSLTLPAGTSLSPGAANGLDACQETGPEGINIEDGESEAVGQEGLPRPVAGHCPPASQVGTLRATTPLLSEELQGHLFLATPRCGGAGQPGCTQQDAQDGNLVGLYAELEGPNSGVIVKLAGKAMIDPSTGRVTTIFEDLPQFPLSNLHVEINGGPRAPLANPQSCGAVNSTSDLTPWSTPATPDAQASSSFNVDWDGAGGACPASLPFGPGFSAGTVSPAAGVFSPFTLTLTRHDREQDLSGVSVTMPPGLLGILKGVPLCGEPQAAQGTCGAASQIGTTEVASGAGPEPLWLTGRVYLTTGYKGAPYGLSIVVPAVAGPFNLGNVVVRAAVSVDPHTAQITVTSDPFPQMLDGIPLRLQTVNVTINREGFTFNATNCATQQVTGSVVSAQGASVGVSSPYTASGCKTLPFKPTFTVSTQAATSKKNGASLVVKTGYPAGSANIHSVAVTLPVQLPARLTTIQQACTQAVFDANPAGCPAGSNIGTATASTPILANPVMGPVYLVSHGGAAFPDIVVILQGEGVTVDLTGSIDIKHNVTSSTFASVPDAPISGFTLTLPEGPHSGLGSNLPAKAKGSFCGQSLVMPTTITAQNGVVVKQSTKIAVTGCPKARKRPKARKASRGAHGGRAGASGVSSGRRR